MYITFNGYVLVKQMEELPATAFEMGTPDAREKSRQERRCLIASLPRVKIEQDFLTSMAENLDGAREVIEDLLMLAAALDYRAGKIRIQQTLRKGLENMT